MTIVTKPLSDKKNDNNQEPLVDGFKVDIADSERGIPPTFTRPSGRPAAFRELVRERRVNTASMACLFLTALIVMSCGVTIGLYLYSQFGQFMRAQMHKLSCKIPYSQFSTEQAEQLTMYKVPYFNEDFEIDNSHEKISIPDFSGGRHSQFIHDFKVNKTSIVDVEGKMCFVMALNYSVVLPPDTLLDLLQKMQEGYYDVDTTVLKDTMRVVLPPISDKSSLGQHIQRECAKYPVYRLEKNLNRVYKRSAEPEVKFVEFAGKLMEFHIVNYNELEQHQEPQPVAMA